MYNIRCGQCDKKLAEGRYSILSIKCPRCGHLNHFENPERHRAPDPGENDGRKSHHPVAGRQASPS